MDNLVHKNPVFSALANCHLFKGVDWQTIQLLSQEAKSSTLERGQLIYPCGSFNPGLFLVITGQVKLSILSANGAERVMDVVRSGETFGESTLFSERCSKLNAEMLISGELIKIPRDSLNRAIEQCPRLASAIMSHLSSKLCCLMDQLENCCLRSARQRIVDYLTKLAKHTVLGEQTIMLPAGKGVIASLLDLTPETFSRELKRLTAMRLIEVDGKRIKILDLQAMQRITI